MVNRWKLLKDLSAITDEKILAAINQMV